MNKYPFDNDWKDFFNHEMNEDYFQKIVDFVTKEREQYDVYPLPQDIFNAYRLTSIANTKVVILGQDPYHGPGQAMGLSFSVQDGCKIPPSLRNIYKEINSEFGRPTPDSGNLARWAEQGVFLLNATLTVRSGSPNSHANCGWQHFTDKTISLLDADDNKKVFLLWGNYAQKKKKLIRNPNHLVLTTTHPSPLSATRGFLGCGHFKRANEFLADAGREQIIW